jgi:hypothetical protein
MMSDNVPAPATTAIYKPNEIIIYGLKLNRPDKFGDIEISDTTSELLFLRLHVYRNSNPLDSDKVAIALVYGYAFEGHCYRLDRAKVMIFKYDGVEPAAEGCGFDSEYKMWRISSKTQLLELDTRVDLAETLILNANLPGKRSPNTYNSEAMLAHRGGRLTRTPP